MWNTGRPPISHVLYRKFSHGFYFKTSGPPSTGQWSFRLTRVRLGGWVQADAVQNEREIELRIHWATKHISIKHAFMPGLSFLYGSIERISRARVNKYNNIFTVRKSFCPSPPPFPWYLYNRKISEDAVRSKNTTRPSHRVKRIYFSISSSVLSLQTRTDHINRQTPRRNHLDAQKMPRLQSSLINNSPRRLHTSADHPYLCVKHCLESFPDIGSHSNNVCRLRRLLSCNALHC